MSFQIDFERFWPPVEKCLHNALPIKLSKTISDTIQISRSHSKYFRDSGARNYNTEGTEIGMQENSINYMH